MPASTARRQPSIASSHCLQLGRTILQQESWAVEQVANRLDARFSCAVEMILACEGSVIVTGMGKAGLVGQKIAATLASTGTPSHFLHPAEAVHGDLGRVQVSDLVVMLSWSGETEEMTRLLASFSQMASGLIAITSSAESTLGRHADCTIGLGPLREADPWCLAPSTTTTAMLALGDALALTVSQQRQFAPQDFARFHPGGTLGRKLARVENVMRRLDRCRLARDTQPVREILVQVSQPGRRTGAIMLVDQRGRLTGVFTDSDLARLFEERREAALDQPISEVMCGSPTNVAAGTMLTDALELLAAHKISELPVVNHAGRPVGIVDITDVVTTPESDEFSPERPDNSRELVATLPFPRSLHEPKNDEN